MKASDFGLNFRLFSLRARSPFVAAVEHVVVESVVVERVVVERLC